MDIKNSNLDNQATQDYSKTDMYWDTFDVPHIISTEKIADIFYALGHAQMRNHGDLVLKLYGQARGRASEYWGSSFLNDDVLMHTLGVYERATSWVAEQSEDFTVNLNNFVKGINDYVLEHPEQIDTANKVVLPVTIEDVLAYSLKLFHIYMMVNFDELNSTITKKKHSGGSNAWVLSSSLCAEGNPILLSSPHLPWDDMYRLFEVHLMAPDLNMYGVAPVGIPILTMAFNDHLGWTHTVNTFKGWTLYELELSSGGYWFDGEEHSFSSKDVVIKVKQDNGTFLEEKITVNNSQHGAILFGNGNSAFALRIAGLDKPRALEQWWSMGCSQSLEDFKKALKQMQIPTFSILYADSDDHIMHFFNGQIPYSEKPVENTSNGIVSGSDSSALWTKTLSFSDLPISVDPPSGWLQNANDPFSFTTLPRVLQTQKKCYDFIMQDSGLSLRAQQSIHLISNYKNVTFDQVVTDHFSRRVLAADRLLDDLVHAARDIGGSLVLKAAEVLEQWDRTVNYNSKGAVLFAYWMYMMGNSDLYANPWSELNPMTTPSNLASTKKAISTLDAVAQNVLATYGALDVEWSSVFELGNGKLDKYSTVFSEDILGVFSEFWYAPNANDRYVSVGGECFSMVVEFSNPVRAEILLLYGNMTQTHLGERKNQFDMYKSKKMRPVWRTKDEFMNHIIDKESFYTNYKPDKNIY